MSIVPKDYRQDDDDDHTTTTNNNNGWHCFRNLANKLLGWGEKNNLANKLPDHSHCIGFSLGWHLLLDKDATSLLIFNPSLNEARKINLHCLSPPCFNRNITKAILTSDPIRCSNQFGVIIIYGYSSKIAYYMYGDTQWRDFQDSHQGYVDILCYRSYILALSGVNNGTIEVWDFKGLAPGKKTRNVNIPNNLVIDLYTCTRMCLVESQGELLLVMRCITERGGLLDDYDEDLSWLSPYRTRNFFVYKLICSDGKLWAKVDSLGDRVLFLDGNHSMSLSALDFQDCKGNSIYFADGKCFIDEHHVFQGHDMGVFGMKDTSIEQIFPVT